MPLTSLATHDGTVVVGWALHVPALALWCALSEPALQGRWLGAVVESDLVPGGSLVVDHGGGYLCRSQVLDVQAPHCLEITWEFSDEPRSRVALQVAGGREEGTDDTALTLTHTDLGSLAVSYGPGWLTHLTYLEAVLDGDDLPASQFWSLHASMERLCAET